EGAFRILTLGEPRDNEEIKACLAPDTSAAFGIESVNGFDSLMLKQVDEASGSVMPTYGMISGPAAFENPQFERFVDLLRARFVLVPAAHPEPVPPARYREAFRDEQVVVYENPRAFPRFFVAPEARWASHEEAIAALASGDHDGRALDPRRVAIVEPEEDVPVDDLPTLLPAAADGAAGQGGGAA